MPSVKLAYMPSETPARSRERQASQACGTNAAVVNRAAA
jgi:hypothetical protein